MARITCYRCHVEKEDSEFRNSSRNKSGKEGTCISCKREISRKSYQNNKEKALKKSKRWNDKNKEYHKQLKKEWYEKNKLKKKEYAKKYYEANKEAYKERQNKRLKKIKFSNLDKIKRRLNSTLRRRLRSKMKFYHSGWHNDVLGCSVESFKEKLKVRDTSDLIGMDIDHIVPESFGKNYCELITLNYNSNLQLLESTKNKEKSNSYISFQSLCEVLYNHKDRDMIESILDKNDYYIKF